MRREFIATTDQGEISIAVEPEGGSTWRVTVGGRVQVIDARLVRPGTWSLLVEGRSYLIDIDARASGSALIAGTREMPVELDDARRKQLARAVSGRDVRRGEVVRAPIAGKVVKTLVAVGDEVHAGQSVAVLEAMKMENEIKAERGGTVATVHAIAGRSVETGEPLLTLS